MPRREKLRAVNKQVVSEKAAMLDKISEITSKDSTDENRSESNNGGIIDFAAKKRRKAKPSKLDKQKKRKVAKSDREIDGDSSSDDGSDDGDSGKINLSKNNKQKITKEQYTFEFNDMKPDYTESICSMLKISLVVNPSAAFVLANSITEQTIVGTSVVCEGGDDVFGFATVLPTEKLLTDKNIANKNSIQNPLVVLLNEFQVKLKSVADKSVQSAFHKYLFDPVHRGASGVLLQGRFSNLPVPLIVDLHKNLNEDIKYALKQSDAEDGFQNMKYLIHISKCSIDGNTPTDLVNITGSASAMYDQFEDEMYGQDADHVLLFKPSNFHGSLAVGLININKLDNIQNNIVKLCL